KPCSVLAHAPTFGLELAGTPRGLQGFLRNACCLIFFGIEPAEVRSDNFIGRISLDTLRALIPGRDHTVRIEMADRVVDHAFDKLAKPRFALQETLLGLAPLGHVTGDFDKAEQGFLFIANGINDGKRPEFRAVLADAPPFAFKTTFPPG